LENKVITKNYDHNLFGFPLLIQNVTDYKYITYPRRRYVEEKSSIIYLYDIPIQHLNDHWRPGSIIPEINYLEKETPLQDLDQYTLKLFTSYVKDPVHFLEENKFYRDRMKDYWCFDHKQIEECFQDFLVANVSKTDPSIFKFYLLKLEKDWQAVFLYEPSYEDLIKSQFLCLPRP